VHSLDNKIFILFTVVTHIESVVRVIPALASVEARVWVLHPGNLKFYVSSLLFCLNGWYCAALTRIQLTFTAWVGSLSARDGGKGENRFCPEPWCFNLAWPSSNWSPFFRCFVCNKFIVECIHSSDDTEQTIKQLHYLTLPKRDSNLTQCIFNWSTAHRLPATKKGQSTSPMTNNFQGDLQTPQSVSIHRPRFTGYWDRGERGKYEQPSC